MIEIPSRMRKLALLSGATCTIIGGVVIWKDSIAGQKVEQIKTEKQLIKDVQERHFIGYLCRLLTILFYILIFLQNNVPKIL